ncbi:hypothetical protein S40293_05951 [Stachybotrys chartarum IBT 40293]|nr:hypothetical protein S40293_05951 [Stachybotrys chartarum IBT 40293]
MEKQKLPELRDQPHADPDIYQTGLVGLSSRFKATLINVLANQSRSFVLAALDRIFVGQIVMKEEISNETHTFGSPGGLTATLTIKNDNVWWRVALGSSIGFAESYMLGEVDCSGLETFLEIMIANREQTRDLSSLVSFFLSKVAGLMRPSNDPSVSLENVKSHYDLSNEVFAAFLSTDMTYSCPIWLPESNKEKNNDDLKSAQLRKLHEVISEAKIKQTDHVLEIGTGWGSFAIEAVRTTGCHITSLTLSSEQKLEAEGRIRAAGLDKNITVLLQDYRTLSKSDQIFDKVVSIEMLEHVGKDHLVEYFSIMNKVLKPNGGILVVQSSTMPETRYSSYNEGNDFIREYIFPGAHVPTTTKIMEAAQTGSNGSFVPDRLINLGGHYSRCLREWRQNFIADFDDRVAPAMLSRNKGMSSFALEQFKRKFIFYFAMCEAGFRTKTLGNSLITWAREGSVETLEQIEL